MTAAGVQQSSSAPRKERTGSSLVHLGRHLIAARVVVLTSSAVGRPMEVVHGEFLCQSNAGVQWPERNIFK
jgi:hypothetical protein